MDYAPGDAVVIIDADLQDPPEVIPELIAEVARGLRGGLRRARRARGRNLVQEVDRHLFYRVIYRITDVEIPLDTGDFRLMDRKVVDALKSMREKHRFMRGMSVWVGFRQTGVQLHPGRAFCRRDQVPAQEDAQLRAGRHHVLLLPPAADGDLHGLRRRVLSIIAHLVVAHLAPVGQRRLLGQATTLIARALPGRRAAHLPGHPRRVPRADLRRGEGPPALYGREALGFEEVKSSVTPLPLQNASRPI